MTTPTPAASSQPPLDHLAAPEASPYRWAILCGVWLVYFAFGLTTVSMAPLVPNIVHDLAMSHAEMGFVLGGWQLVYIVTAAPCGAVIDRLGPQVGLLLSAAFIAASGVLRAYSVDFWSLLLAVGVFGIGGPLVSIGAPKLISLWFRGPERGLAMGIYVTGPATGGIVAFSLTNSVFMPAFDADWRSVLLMFAGAAALCGAVWLAISAHPEAIAVERRLKAEPKEKQFAVFAKLLRLPTVQLMLVMSVGIFFFNHGLNNWLPELLRTSGMSAAAAGIWASLPTAVGIAGALLIPRWATPERRLLVLALLFCSAGIAALLLLTGNDTMMAVGMVAQGIARSSMMTVMILLLVELKDIGSRYAGAASGLFFSAAEVGGVLGPLTLGAVFDTTGSFSPSLVLLAVVMMGLALMLLPLRRQMA